MLSYLSKKLGMSKFKVGAIASLLCIGMVSSSATILGSMYGFLTPIEQIAAPFLSAAYFMIAGGYFLLPDRHHVHMSLAFKIVAGLFLMVGQIDAALSEVNNIEFYLPWIPTYYIALLFAYLKEKRFSWGYSFFALSTVSTLLCLIFGPLVFNSRGAILMMGVVIAQSVLVFVLASLERYLKRAGANEARTKILRESTKQLKLAAEESEAARQEATQANLAKSRFIANMSHELRTPLNSIIGFSEILKQTDNFGDLQAQYCEYVNHIHDSGNHLLYLVNEILDVAKIEAGKMTLRETDVWLDEIIDSAAITVDALAAKKNIALNIDDIDTSLTLFADPKMLKQMVLNLLSNAVKFTEEGGAVDVRSYIGKGGSIVVSVSDNGIGMNENDIQNVMQPFVQAQNAYAREQGGTGLGLYLVHAMMRLHDGSAHIDSTPGQGTTVTLLFPADRHISKKLSA